MSPSARRDNIFSAVNNGNTYKSIWRIANFFYSSLASAAVISYLIDLSIAAVILRETQDSGSGAT